MNHPSLKEHYRSDESHFMREFYVRGLDFATTYDRATGFFSSSIFQLSQIAYSTFALRGGRVRLICSPRLSELDGETLHDTEIARRSADEAIRIEWNRVIANARNEPAAKFFAAMLGTGCLTVRLAVRVRQPGLYHEKLGVFTGTNGERITFIGSANETGPAWSESGNYESFEVFAAWWGERDAARCARHAAEFEQTWRGETPGLLVHDISDETRRLITERFPSTSLEEAADEVRRASSEVARAEALPALGPHQREVLAAWKAQAKRGIVKHATGAGKTITALAALAEWCDQGGVAVVLVPSDLLSQQWTTQIERYLSEKSLALLHCGGSLSAPDWRTVLRDFSSADYPSGRRICIATLATASKPDFLTRVSGGAHVLVVADEVHRVGATEYQRICGLDAQARLGLSATPERFRDPSGTAALFAYFGDVLKPVVSLQDAIALGRLVPYDYFIVTAELTLEEYERWKLLSDEIGREYAKLRGKAAAQETSARLEFLLIARARVAKNASNKTRIASKILSEQYSEGERWLVYCDNAAQLAEVLRELRASGLPAFEYHSAMLGDKHAVLEHLTQRGGIAVAIKCLDEGVDIPVVDRALILASSKNPREFIQRRGRVLRKVEGKYSAAIYDVVTVPPSTGEDEPIAARTLVQGELARALEFAMGSRNRDVRYQIEDIAARYRLARKDLSNPEHSGEEESDGEE